MLSLRKKSKQHQAPSAAAVALKPITIENFNDAMALERKNTRFVGSAADVLAEGYVFREDSAVYGIYAAETIVGLVLLLEEPRRGYYEFTNLFIADTVQHRGFGTAAVRAVLEKYKKERKADTVKLQVHKLNKYAIRSYEACGFTITGQSKWDENFWVMICALTG
ncbi:MAG: GNAT family N-acetyltransferase [Oscillospiraceae bacterium]|jgi:ribosomal protein S18 acetylase RimI-like enzyme|nr:GNAT family N-acetyltransferase [Oscillospiraceae bacterium]